MRSPCICEGTCSEEPCMRNPACISMCGAIVRSPWLCEFACTILFSEEPMYKDPIWTVRVRVYVVRSSSEDPSEGPFGES